MFFPSDSTTEVVAHFLGYFQLATEDMRLRLSYEEIAARASAQFGNTDIEQLSAEFAQTFGLGNYLGGVSYTPPTWLIHGRATPEAVNTPAQMLYAAPQFALPWSPDVKPGAPSLPAATPSPQMGAEPGSLIAIISQTISLSDNDVIILGSYDGPLVFHSGADDGIGLMHSAAAQVSGLVTGMANLSSIGDVPLLVENLAREASGLSSDPADAQMSVNITDDLTGVYLDGRAIAQAPELADALPAPWNNASSTGRAVDTGANDELGDHVVRAGDAVADIVMLKAGGNLLINEANLVNAGLNGSVVAVDGDVHELDAIIQVNAYLDLDTIDDGFPGALWNPVGTTTAHNMATMVQESFHSASTGGHDGPSEVPEMPLNWQVSMVSGNMMFVQWLSQFTFVSDQDVAVLSSTGTSTLVTSGENIALNNVSFADLGDFFDLILIGGNLYDANIIVQTNVLYDNDTIRMFSAEHDGSGALNTSGNLLWNQASIKNVGPGQYQHDMPDHFEQATDGLESGDMDMPAGFATDSLFDGIQMLKVLYITGDVYDLRYVEQTNILGDADFVATQQASLLAGHPQTEWDISTGSNALVNTATITDHDSIGNTAFVGGSVYSDAILIQADILAADADEPSADRLVTEVIAFLDVDLDLSIGHDDIGSGFELPANDGPTADIMQSMLT